MIDLSPQVNLNHTPKHDLDMTNQDVSYGEASCPVISRAEFRHFKAFESFSLTLTDLNVLVGPNNSGKSTIINAFRVLGMGLRRASSRAAELVPGPDGDEYGYPIPSDDLPMSLENVHTNYDRSKQSSVIFHLSNKSSLTLYFPSIRECVLLTSKRTRTAAGFKKEYPLRVGFVPVLGPLEHEEPLVEYKTVQRNLTTHRASRNFRNYWRYFPENFDQFAEMLKHTWPGMEVTPPEIVGFDKVAMFCKESEFTRELYWAGLGFQVWCQLLTHIVRSRDANLLVVDEPDIYLHPDLQRQILVILREAGPRILLATHSTEIVAEADPSDIVIIDKSKRSGNRLKDVTQVQNAIEILGSRQNITLTQLARTRRVLFVEGLDFKILSRFARVLGLVGVANPTEFVVVPIGGQSQWTKLVALDWGLKSTLGESFVMAVVFDRDYLCDEEVQEIQQKLATTVALVHFHGRKELENYLLIPTVLDRVLKRRAREVARTRGGEDLLVRSVADILDHITEPMRAEIQGHYIGSRLEYFRRSGRSPATISREALDILNKKWNDIETRMEIVPGKEVFAQLNTYLQDNYNFNVTANGVIAECQRSEVPSDLVRFLRQVEVRFKRSKHVGGNLA